MIKPPPRVLSTLDTLSPLDSMHTLYHLAAAVPSDEAIVELGTYKGASACWLAAGAQAGLGALVWTIDPHDLPGFRTTTGRGKGGLDFTQATIREQAAKQIKKCGLTEHVTMVRGFSVEEAQKWDGPKVGLLFIDGDHREHAARKDFRSWQPHLTREAVVCWDDYAPSHPGVPAAVAGLVKRHILYKPDVYGRLALTGLVPPKERALLEGKA
ncbi:MAG TPA: class I SAM-dependent methyltransferase [Beutenbergiaceae bacterium]|nr:class I SAM-dependent methyltransferase [Beutenbergiaceae bacterium]